MIRRFDIYNAANEHYNLNDLENFFHSVEGLGYGKKVTTEQIGTTFQIIAEKNEQIKVSGKIRFKKPDAYAKYEAFYSFLQKTPLRLEYAPYDKAYSLDCIVTECEKKELTRNSLEVEIEFTGFDLWYRKIKKTGDTTVTIVSDTEILSPCKFTITAADASKSPGWNHTYINSSGGNTTVTGRINGTVTKGTRLLSNTEAIPYELRKDDASNKISMYEVSDFSTQRFFFLHKGKNVFTGVNVSKIEVEAMLKYETV